MFLPRETATRRSEAFSTARYLRRSRIPDPIRTQPGRQPPPLLAGGAAGGGACRAALRADALRLASSQAFSAFW